MNVVGRVGSLISQGVYSVATPFHPFGGAVDVIVVQQQDGTFRSTPWYVRFGKFQGVLKGAEKVVRISVNGVEANFHMYLDNSGEAYFIKEVDAGKGSEINGVVKDSDNLEVGDNNKDSTIDDIHRLQHSVSDSGVLRFPDEYVPLHAGRIEIAESDADRRFYDFQDEQSSLEGSVELSEYGSNRYESLNGEDFVEPQSTESEVVLVSVDGLVLTAPISASEQDTENVQLSIPQFHLGPGEQTDFCEGNEEFSSGENVWAADYISNLSALPANIATYDFGSISSNDHAAGLQLEVCEGVGDHVCQAQEALDITDHEGEIPMESESEEVSANVTREEVFKCPLELSELTKQVNNDNLEDVVSSLDVKNSLEISQRSPPAINEDKDGGAVEPRNDDGLSAFCSFSSPGNETSPCVQVGVESLEKNAWDAEHRGSDSKLGHSVSRGLKSEVSSLDVKNLEEISQQSPPAINEDKDGGAVEPRNDDGLSASCSSSSPGNETSPVVQVGVESSEKNAWDAEHMGSDRKSGHSISHGLKSEVSSLDVKNAQEISQQSPPAINEDKDRGAVEPRNDDGLSASCISSSPGNETSPGVQVGVESSEKNAWDAEHMGSDSKSGHSVSRGLKSEVSSLDVKNLQEISQQSPPSINEDKDGGAVEPRNDDGLSASCSSSFPGNETSPGVQVGVESSEKIAWDAEHTVSDRKMGHSVSHGLKSEDEKFTISAMFEGIDNSPQIYAEEDQCNEAEPAEPQTAVSSDEIQAQSIIKFEISLCRNELHPGMGLEAAAEAFDARRVSAEKFKTSAASIMRNENLVIRFRERYLLWEKAAPLVLGMSAFGLDLPVEPKDAIPVEQIGTPQPRDDDSGSASSSGRRWRLWPPFRRVKSLEHSSSSSSNEDVFVDSESGNSQGISTMASYDGNESPHKQFVRTNVPTNEQIASLNLSEGQNIITFSFSTRVLGRQQVEAHIYLWRWNAKIVISDVDGTITKSDVLGQFMPLVGRDWSQSGVARLFSAIEENGYQLLFLSARAIVQAYLTRNFLLNLKQDGKTLPKGPVVISPDGLFPSLYREVIRRAPHEFKIGCLEDIRKLFPSEYNPFYAGFGNRDTDELSYRKMGIPKGKIFIINPKGEVATSHRVDVKSYTSLHTLVNDMFPPTSLAEQEDFNSWNFWKMPLLDIDLS